MIDHGRYPGRRGGKGVPARSCSDDDSGSGYARAPNRPASACRSAAARTDRRLPPPGAPPQPPARAGESPSLGIGRSQVLRRYPRLDQHHLLAVVDRVHRRDAHGLRNFANYRLRLLLACGVAWQNATTAQIRTRNPRLSGVEPVLHRFWDVWWA